MQIFFYILQNFFLKMAEKLRSDMATVVYTIATQQQERERERGKKNNNGDRVMTGRRSLSSIAQESISISPGDPLRDLFEGCKHGDVPRVRALVTGQNVNARDTAGRKSSPLHFAAGRGERIKRLKCYLSKKFKYYISEVL